MKFIFKKWLLSSVLIFIAVSGCAKAIDIGDVSVNENVIRVEINNNFQNFKFFHDVEGYDINCQKTYISAWGHSQHINVNSPQETILTIVDLINRKKLSIYKSSKGIFGYAYLKNGTDAYIDSDLPVILKLKSGAYTSILNQDPPNSDLLEQCDDFKQKVFRRYRE